MENERILVTGITGQIGKVIAEKLLEEGFVVIGVTRNPSAGSITHKNFKQVIADILDPESLEDIFNDIDQVVHLAGLTHTNNTKLYHQVNVLGTKNLLEVSLKKKIKRFIYFGSRADNPEGGGYSSSKHHAANLVKNSGCPYVILRPAEVYGVGGEGLSLFQSILWNYPFIATIKDRRAILCPIHVEDVVRSTLTIINDHDIVNKNYLIAGPDSFKFHDLVLLAKQHYQLKKILLPTPIISLRLLAYISGKSQNPAIYRDQIDRLISKKDNAINQTIEDLGFTPRSIHTSLDSLFKKATAR